NSGISVFISSHLLSEIEMICDRVAILKEGAVVIEKQVSDLLLAEEQYDFKVDDIKRAIEALAGTAYVVNAMDERTVRIDVTEENIPTIVEIFVHNGVKVYGIQAEKETLEDKFLDIVENLQEVN